MFSWAPESVSSMLTSEQKARNMNTIIRLIRVLSASFRLSSQPILCSFFLACLKSYFSATHYPRPVSALVFLLRSAAVAPANTEPEQALRSKEEVSVGLQGLNSSFSQGLTRYSKCL